MQVVPETQVPLPVHPSPAHWLHFASVPPAAAEDVVAAALELLLEVDVESVVPGELVVVGWDEVTEELTTTPPGPATEVVREPLST